MRIKFISYLACAGTLYSQEKWQANAVSLDNFNDLVTNSMAQLGVEQE